MLISTRIKSYLWFVKLCNFSEIYTITYRRASFFSPSLSPSPPFTRMMSLTPPLLWHQSLHPPLLARPTLNTFMVPPLQPFYSLKFMQLWACQARYRQRNNLQVSPNVGIFYPLTVTQHMRVRFRDMNKKAHQRKFKVAASLYWSISLVC